MGPFQEPWLPSHPSPTQSWAPWRIWQALILIKWCSHDLLTFTFNLKDRVSRPGASQWAARWLAIHCLLWKTHIGPQAPLPTLFTLSYLCKPHSPPKRNSFEIPEALSFPISVSLICCHGFSPFLHVQPSKPPQMPSPLPSSQCKCMLFCT